MDALPIHAFQKTDKGWRERLVDLAVTESKSDISLVDSETNNRQASRSLSQYSTVEDVNDLKLHTNGKRPRFRFVLAPGRTPALTSLLNVNPEGRVEGMGSVKLDSAPEGSIIEVCPEAMILAQDIALRIDSCTGAALIIDYGDEGSSDSLRAFNMHKQISVLSSPGMVDVTADVDFKALREAVNIGLESIWNNNTRGKLGKPIAFGPITQAKFLASMGAMERSIMLIEDEKTSDEQAEELYNALERLVSPEQMGERYKVLAIAYKKDGIFPPPGF
jgi:NADH dehydrogenase [ubiquinone] 1 alpha subcomplex assembly factor 7